MTNELPRIKTQIDFSTTRGHQNSSLLYTVLMFHNKGGNTSCNASQLITLAYDSYDSSETYMETMFFDLKSIVSTFMDEYAIIRKQDIIDAAKKKDPLVRTELLEPGKKFICLDADDPKTQELWSDLQLIRFRDRASVINKWLYQYFAHGNCRYYNRLCASILLESLKLEDLYRSGSQTQRLDTIADMIWRISGKEEPGQEKPVYTVEELDNMSEDEKRLRYLLDML